ncbi:MAG: tetratricopeptide repeat protein, partial [Bacteroidia bacterium]
MYYKIKKQLCLLLFILTLFAISGLNAAIGTDIQAIITSYETGDLDRTASLLRASQPENSDEKAIVLYYKAMLTTEAGDAQILLQQVVDTYPKNQYAQKALYELGSLQLLDRDYDKALSTFNKITNPDFSDKHYWLANTYFQKGDYSNAIASANQFIRLTKSSPQLEDAYYLIADSYINLDQYNSTITILKKLLTQPKLIEDEQYLRYRYGFAAEMLNLR